MLNPIARLIFPILSLLLSNCVATDATRINYNLMSDEEIVAYNDAQERVWDEIICIRQVKIGSHIRSRYCATASTWNRRGVSSAESLNIISFGTPQIYH